MMHDRCIQISNPVDGTHLADIAAQERHNVGMITQAHYVDFFLKLTAVGHEAGNIFGLQELQSHSADVVESELSWLQMAKQGVHAIIAGNNRVGQCPGPEMLYF